MYDPASTEEDLERFIARYPALQEEYPDGVPVYSVSDAQALTKQIVAAADPDGKPLRPLTPEEIRFTRASAFRCTLDYPYFAERFVQIDDQGAGLKPLYPLWESQTYLLQQLARLERQSRAAQSPDGLLLNILKIRQVGITTIGVSMVAHRIYTRPYIRALVGSDVEAQAGYLFRIGMRIYDHLPWFLKPAVIGYNKDREQLLGNHSSLRTAWGKTTRGALQEVGGKKGNIERGRTYATVHISELATWDNPEQLDSALLPGIPVSRWTICLFESTAELPEDWWHRQWRTAAQGYGRFRNLFIAAYAVPSKYALPPPEGWVPKSSTLAWVNKAEAESPLWCLGETIRPTKAQAYWYETTRAFYEAKGKLHDFKREYPSDPEECFAYSGLSIFSHEQLEVIDSQAKSAPLDLWYVEPAAEIAALSRVAEEDPQPPDRRVPVPLTPDLRLPIAHHEHPVPAGWGFRRVPATDVKARLEADNKDPHVRFEGFLAIWEYPRGRGARRYIISADVGDGVGLDYSVVDVIRLPTVEEAAEQVAQFVSHTTTPNQLAGIIDAIGRLYVDLDGIEAKAAIESNIGPGLVTQNDLQLHLGYTHFYIWEVLDAASTEKRYTTRIGWATTPRSRPIIISRFHDAVTTADPLTGQLDLRLNSAVTRQELRHLIIPKEPGARLGDAAAAPGHFDDAIMTSAIGYFVAWQDAGGETEPIAEKRRRRSALLALSQETGQRHGDWRNTATTAEEANTQIAEDDDLYDSPAGVFFDERSRVN
jgi:hypothetical protein